MAGELEELRAQFARALAAARAVAGHGPATIRPAIEAAGHELRVLMAQTEAARAHVPETDAAGRRELVRLVDELRATFATLPDEASRALAEALRHTAS